MPVNTTVKLAALQHIPSVKSNLMSQDNNGSQSDLLNAMSPNTGINYANMPIGKRTVLAPLGQVSPLIGNGGKEKVLNSMNNANQR